MGNAINAGKTGDCSEVNTRELKRAQLRDIDPNPRRILLIVIHLFKCIPCGVNKEKIQKLWFMNLKIIPAIPFPYFASIFIYGKVTIQSRFTFPFL